MPVNGYSDSGRAIIFYHQFYVMIIPTGSAFLLQLCISTCTIPIYRITPSLKDVSTAVLSITTSSPNAKNMYFLIISKDGNIHDY